MRVMPTEVGIDQRPADQLRFIGAHPAHGEKIDRETGEGVGREGWHCRLRAIGDLNFAQHPTFLTLNLEL